MTDTARQIKQMVNFIMQEAHEKVNEIRIKVSLFALTYFPACLALLLPYHHVAAITAVTINMSMCLC
jgi:hypothetical protein